MRGRVGLQGVVLLSLLVLAAEVGAAGAVELVWVFLRDKVDDQGARVAWDDSPDPRPAAALDLAVVPGYVAILGPLVQEVRAISRWLNAVSVVATEPQVIQLRGLPFVRGVTPVGRYARSPVPTPPEPDPTASGKDAGTALPEYGVSYAQLAQLHVTDLHLLGYQGAGIRIALLDDGFHHSHRCFSGLRVAAARDFINGDDDVTDQDGQPVTGDETRTVQNLHGAQVLSLLAGNDPDRFVGVAPEAEYILAKTEEYATELPVEEDRWVAGLEWADSLGARVVNSSLGYNLWDDGSGYTWAQMDGATAVTTRAAEIAVQRGIVVVAAAGNEGDNAWQYVTAPADGPGVISVGAVDLPQPGLRDPVLAASSSRGPTADGRIKPDVVAPGQFVVVAEVRGSDYQRASGTSYAAPLVSGVCALLLQAHPPWTPAQVQQALRETATDLGPAGPDTAYGWGQVNALAASGMELPVPEESRVAAPFPNPVRGDRIFFPLSLASAGTVQLQIYELSGALVATVFDGRLAEGIYVDPDRALHWDLNDEEADRGVRLANGLLLYRLTVAGIERQGKLALLRPSR
ncbi:MAG: S8 family serine peptidase [Candidatus Latescibacterota bacterium]